MWQNEIQGILQRYPEIKEIKVIREETINRQSDGGLASQYVPQTTLTPDVLNAISRAILDTGFEVAETRMEVLVSVGYGF